MWEEAGERVLALDIIFGLWAVVVVVGVLWYVIEEVWGVGADVRYLQYCMWKWRREDAKRTPPARQRSPKAAPSGEDDASSEQR